ncbi:MAG TPA: hypothetical protein VFJ24_08215 [Gaiellales bacterium]|nr:hypothetical protein [Gaiellales bacterium]
MPASDRVRERRKAAALARHYRDEESLSIAEIARRLGRAEATVKAYLYDPSQANKRPSDSLQERHFWAVWSCTDVDLQASPGLTLRRHQAGSARLPDLSGSRSLTDAGTGLADDRYFVEAAGSCGSGYGRRFVDARRRLLSGAPALLLLAEQERAAVCGSLLLVVPSAIVGADPRVVVGKGNCPGDALSPRIARR